MRAATTLSFGPPSVLALADRPAPAVGPNDIRVRVVAAPVTAGDRRLRAADFPGISAIVGRLMFGLTAPRNPVQGTCFAGQVVEVGDRVTDYAVGDNVFGGTDHGAYAEYISVRADGPIAKMPTGVSYADAATLQYGPSTAMTFLRDLAKLKPGESVLVLGASGGVGRYAVQLAKYMGANVTAVCSQSAFELMQELGADHVIDHRTSDFTQNGQTYDVIFDIADASSFTHSRGSLTATGRYMTLYISVGVVLQMAWTALKGGRRALFTVATGSADGARELAGLLQNRVIDPVDCQTFGLADIAEAHALAESGVHGEVIVDINGGPPLHAVG